MNKNLSKRDLFWKIKNNTFNIQAGKWFHYDIPDRLLKFQKNALPDDLLYHILDFCDHDSLLLNCLFVCKKFGVIIFKIVKLFSFNSYFHLKRNAKLKFGDVLYWERMQGLEIHEFEFVPVLYRSVVMLLSDERASLSICYDVACFVDEEIDVIDERIYREDEFEWGETKIGGVGHYEGENHPNELIDAQFNLKDIVMFDFYCLLPPTGLLIFSKAGVCYQSDMTALNRVHNTTANCKKISHFYTSTDRGNLLTQVLHHETFVINTLRKEKSNPICLARFPKDNHEIVYISHNQHLDQSYRFLVYTN